MSFPPKPKLVQGRAKSVDFITNNEEDNGLTLNNFSEVSEVDEIGSEVLLNELGIEKDDSLLTSVEATTISSEQKKALDMITNGSGVRVVEDAGKGYPGVIGDYGNSNETKNSSSFLGNLELSPVKVTESIIETLEGSTGNLSFEKEVVEDLGLDLNMPIETNGEIDSTILREKGLIKERPEIISVSEFKPIQDDVSDLNESTIKIAVDTVNEKKVTNIARLIELHRQIRDFILSATKKIKDKIYGKVNSDELFTVMRKVFVENYIDSDILKDNIHDSIDSVINFFINGEYETGSNSFSNLEIKNIASSKKDNTFFRGLVEFIILDVIVVEMIKNFGNIINFSSSTKNAMSLKKYTKFKDFNPDSAISNSIVAQAFYDNSITNNDDYYKDVTGINEGLDNFELYQQLGASLISELCCYDSVNFSSGYKGNKTFNSENGKIQIGLQGDMAAIFKKIRKVVPESYGTSNLTEVGSNTRINTDNIYKIYKGIVDKDGQEKNDSLINLSECITTFVFFNTLRKVDNKIDNSQLFGTTDFSNPNPGNVIRYCQENFEIPGASVYSFSKNEFDVVSNLNLLKENTFLGTVFKPRTGTISENNQINYSPLQIENTNDYMGGLNYFIKNLEAGRTEDFYQFKNEYYSGANSFIRTFYSYFPDQKLASIFSFDDLSEQDSLSSPAVNYNPLLKSDMLKEGIKFIQALRDDLETLMMPGNNFINAFIIAGRKDDDQILRVLRAYYWRYYERSLGNNTELSGKAGSISNVPKSKSAVYQKDFLKESLRKLFSTMFKGTILTYNDDNEVGEYSNSSFNCSSSVLNDPLGKGSAGLGDKTITLPKEKITDIINLDALISRKNFDNLVNFYEEKGVFGSFKFSFEQFFYISFMTVHWLIRKSLRLYVLPVESGPHLFLEVDGTRGLLKGLEDAILEVENNEELSFDLDSISTSGSANAESAREYNSHAYNIAKQFAKRILDSIDYKQESIRSHLTAIAGHADSIREAYDIFSKPTGTIQDLIKNTIQSNSLKTKEDLPDSFLSERISNYNNSFTATDLHINRKKFFITNSSLTPINDTYILNKTKMMYNFLTQEGYGLLKSEKFGSKEILNIGLTKGLVDYLKEEASLSTGNDAYQNSPYVAVSVFKQSHFNSNVIYQPKIYVFDTSISIEDYDIDGVSKSNHLKLFHNDMTINQMIENIQVNRYFIGKNNDIITDVKIGSEACFDKNILINHIFDYMLKEYQKVLTGLDYSESSFLLRETPIHPRIVTPGIGLGQDIVTEIEKFVFKIERIYGRVVGNDLRSEIFRMVNVVKESYPFANKNNFERIITPKMFDRTYSVLINEKDFIIGNSSAYDNDDYKLFENNQQPNYSITSKLLKPDYEKDNQSYYSEINDYLYESKEASITSNNYFINVGILPIDFSEGSDTLFNQIVGI